RKKCLDDVGYLDEDFNMFLEDVDMGIRCTKKGWKLHTCSGSIIYHKLHGTIGNEENADYWKEANRLMLIAKHWPEELPDALMGRGFFSVQNSLDPGRDISSVLSRVYSKILKEHGRETLDKISPVLFSSVRKIYNFEKDLFLQKLANAQDDENRLNEELNTLREQKNELALLKQQREKEILEIIRQKDREISSILHQKDREIASILEDKQNQLDCLRQLKDREISSLIERKEAELSEATESWKKELDNVSLELQKKNNDLVNLYSSSGYRYILKPMWDFLWPIKQRLRKGKNNLRLSLIKIKSNYLITRDILKKIALTSSKLLGFWSAGLLSSRFKFIYLNHLKHNTMPVMPKRLILMINKKCNLQCSFCDIPKAKDREVDLDKSAAYKAIDAASRMGLTDLIITGGEPLLHPGLFEITEYAKSRNLKVTLTSNGILIRQNIERIIKAKFAYISISIDGNEPTHDNLRNKIGAYREAAEAIILLKKHGVDTFINFVITNKNISQLEEVYRHFQKQGVTVIFFPVINKPELSSLSREQKSAFLKFIKALRSEGGLSKQEYDYLKDSVLLYLEGKKVNTRCLGLNFEFAINNKGDISPCCLWDNKKEALNRLGNIFENDLEELWFSGEFHKARKSIFQEGCRQCFNPSLSEFSKLTGLSYFAHGI
ncbi:MAG: radical SAM protein, partial [Candidatus Omnitrophica bacterium]|nr:radical SAM protein [Candidatus Omnitrophota bacterium]